MKGLKELPHAKWQLAWLIMLFLLVLPVYGCQGPIDKLSTILDEQQARIKATLNQAIGRANGLVIQAGIQASSVIENARVAFGDELDTSMDKLDTVSTRKIQSIQTMVDDLSSGLDANVKMVSDQALTIVTTLPFTKTTPRVTSVTPGFYAWSSTPQQISLDIGGLFLFANQAKYRPYLLFDNTQYELKENTDTSLTFLITPSVTSKPTTQFTLSQMTLSVPYQEGTVIKKDKTATYNLLLGTLPENPGKIEMQKMTTTTTNTVEHIVTPSWYQTGPDVPPASASGFNVERLYHSEPIPDDWTVVQNSTQFIVEVANKVEYFSDGTSLVITKNVQESPTFWTKQLTNTTAYVGYSVKTHYWHENPFKLYPYYGTEVRFHFEYDIQGRVKTQTTERIPINITWGQSQAINIKDASSWKVLFDPFDGKHEEIAAPKTLRYISVRMEGDFVTIGVPDTKVVAY